MKTEINNTENLAKIKTVIESLRICMFTTLHADGMMHSRPMSTSQMDADGSLWFFSNESSEKSFDIKSNPMVSLSYTDERNSTYYAIKGYANIITDKTLIQTLWNPILKVWFPKGIDDPDLSLIKVELNSVEYWDASSFKMVQLYQMAKAFVTGTKADLGKHGIIEIEK